MKNKIFYITVAFIFITTIAEAKISQKKYFSIFQKYNVSDNNTVQGIINTCVDKFGKNNIKIETNSSGEKIINHKNEKEFLNCTYQNILQVIRPIQGINTLKQKELEKFLLENEIYINFGKGKETYIFKPDGYEKFKDGKKIGNDGWRWSKLKQLRVFMDGEKTTWRVSGDKMALSIKKGKDKPQYYFLEYKDKKKAEEDRKIAKKKAEERKKAEAKRKEEEKKKAEEKRIAEEKLAKLNERKQDKLDKLDKIVQGNKENYNKLLDITSIKTKMQKNTDELNSILNQYDKTISDIRIEITNFNNFDDIENYQISSNFIDPLNEVLKLSDNNLDKLNSEYEAFKIEKERKRIEEEKRLAEEKIEKEKRLAEEKRKKIEKEKRLAEEKRQALEQKCGQYKVDNSKLDFMGVTAGISWDCFKYIMEKNDFDCGHGIIEDLFVGKLSGCKKIGKEGSYISFMENKKSIYFTCGSFKGCDRTLTELAQLIVDKYANKFGSFEMLPHYDSATQSNVYRGSNPKNDQLIEVGKGMFGGTYVLFNQRETLNF